MFGFSLTTKIINVFVRLLSWARAMGKNKEEAKKELVSIQKEEVTPEVVIAKKKRRTKAEMDAAKIKE
jgi:hypothetical protein